MFYKIGAVIIAFGMFSLGYEIYTTSYWDSPKYNYNFDFTGFNVPVAILFYVFGIYLIFIVVVDFFKHIDSYKIIAVNSFKYINSDKNNKWKFVAENKKNEYKCGLKSGDRLILKKDFPQLNFDGLRTGYIYHKGENWEVLKGEIESDMVYLRQPNGISHSLKDDSQIFDYFDKISQ